MLFLKAEHIVQAWESSGPSLKGGGGLSALWKRLVWSEEEVQCAAAQEEQLLEGGWHSGPCASWQSFCYWATVPTLREDLPHTKCHYSVGDEQWLQNGQKGFKMLPAQMENFSHSDLVITHCKRILKCYAVARKCAQLCANWNQNHVKNKKTKI